MSVAIIPDRHKNHFAIFTSNKTYHLKAASNNEVSDWIKILKSLIDIDFETNIINNNSINNPNRQSFTDESDEIDNDDNYDAYDDNVNRQISRDSYQSESVISKYASNSISINDPSKQRKVSRPKSIPSSPNSDSNSLSLPVLNTNFRNSTSSMNTQSTSKQSRTQQQQQPTSSTVNSNKNRRNKTANAVTTPILRSNPSGDNSTSRENINEGSRVFPPPPNIYDYSGDETGFTSGASDSINPSQPIYTLPPINDITENEDDNNLTIKVNNNTKQNPKDNNEQNKNKSSENTQDSSQLPIPKVIKRPVTYIGTEQVIETGCLLRLRKRYNQWRKFYIVLTDQRLCFYKSPSSTSTASNNNNNNNNNNNKNNEIFNVNDIIFKMVPDKIIKIGDLIDAVEIDSLSSTKNYCMLIITPLKRIRFCASNEEDLTKWLVAIKRCILNYSKQKDDERNLNQNKRRQSSNNNSTAITA